MKKPLGIEIDHTHTRVCHILSRVLTMIMNQFVEPLLCSMITHTFRSKDPVVYEQSANLWCILVDKETNQSGLFAWNKICCELRVCSLVWSNHVTLCFILKKLVFMVSSNFSLAWFAKWLYSPWKVDPALRWQYRQDCKQIAMAFSLIFDDAVLPSPFVFCLGHSCHTRCYPCSPPKNLRPRATAPQTLNRSIRHTVLRAAGVWAVAAGACLVPRPVACTLSPTQTRSCTPHCRSYLLLCAPF